MKIMEFYGWRMPMLAGISKTYVLDFVKKMITSRWQEEFI